MYKPVYRGVASPVFLSFHKLLRDICLRESIDLVHAHGSLSFLGMEAIRAAHTYDIPTCFTDHSLFAFNDTGSIVANKLLKTNLSVVSHVICVSHTGRENTVLRGALDPVNCSVIPNAVDCNTFRPDVSRRPSNRINIIVVSRLVFRKGIDLLVGIIPIICAKFPSVDFIIGGDGPKRLLLDEMIDSHQLHSRVNLVGALDTKGVVDLLVQGHIFLNCSLTEAFCMAILEAASCGLLVCSTSVGGIPEVLPKHMVRLANAEVDDLVEALSSAINEVRDISPHQFHAQVRNMYGWDQVAVRTERVYEKLMSDPPISLVERIRLMYAVGFFAGKMFLFMIGAHLLLCRLIEWYSPAAEIEKAQPIPVAKFRESWSSIAARKESKP